MTQQKVSVYHYAKSSYGTCQDQWIEIKFLLKLGYFNLMKAGSNMKVDQEKSAEDVQNMF